MSRNTPLGLTDIDGMTVAALRIELQNRNIAFTSERKAGLQDLLRNALTANGNGKKNKAKRSTTNSVDDSNKRQKTSSPESEGLDPVFQEDQMDSAFKVAAVNEEWEEANRWIANQLNGSQAIPTILSRTTQVRARLLNEGNLVLFAGKLTNKKWGLAIFKVVGQSEFPCEISRVQLKVSAEFVSVSDSYSLDNSLEVYTWTAKDINCVTALVSSSLGYKGFDRGSRHITLLDNSRDSPLIHSDGAGETAASGVKAPFTFRDDDGRLIEVNDKNNAVKRTQMSLPFRRACVRDRFDNLLLNERTELSAVHVKEVLATQGLLQAGGAVSINSSESIWGSTAYHQIVSSLPVYIDGNWERFLTFNFGSGSVGGCIELFERVSGAPSDPKARLIDALRNYGYTLTYAYGNIWEGVFDQYIRLIDVGKYNQIDPEYLKYEYNLALTAFNLAMRSKPSPDIRNRVGDLLEPSRCVKLLTAHLDGVRIDNLRQMSFNNSPRSVGRLASSSLSSSSLSSSTAPVPKPIGAAKPDGFCVVSLIFSLGVQGKRKIAPQPCSRANCRFKHLVGKKPSSEVINWWKQGGNDLIGKGKFKWAFDELDKVLG